MATTNIPVGIRDVTYTRYAREYLASLKLENFMESTAQATQREITLAAFALVQRRHPNVRYFNELLVQYPIPRKKRPGQVVPDNLVLLSDTPLRCETYYSPDIHPATPFWALEYVSAGSQRKDYERNIEVYERIGFQYYLTFYPDAHELTLFRLNAERAFRAVPPNDRGRIPLAELDLEMAILGGWTRFWHRSELLELPAALEDQRDQARVQRDQAQQQLSQRDELLAERDRQMAEMARELARLRGEQTPRTE